MAEVGYITAEQAKAAKAKPLKVNIRPFGTQIYAADYFAEEVRRTLVDNFGEDGLYGRAERTGIGGDRRQRRALRAHHARSQPADASARKALIDGLVAFDREKGWRGPVQQIDIAGDWGVPLAGIEIPTDLAAVAARRGARGADRPRPSLACARHAQADGSLAAEREAVEIPFDEVKWAKVANRARAQGRDRRAQPRRRRSGWRPRTRHSRRASGR